MYAGSRSLPRDYPSALPLGGGRRGRWGAGSGCSAGTRSTSSGLLSQRSGMDRLLPSEVGMAASLPNVRASRPAWITMASQEPPPTRPRPAWGPGGGERVPRRPQRVEAALPPYPCRPAVAVAAVPYTPRFHLVRSSDTAGLAMPGWTVSPRPADCWAADPTASGRPHERSARRSSPDRAGRAVSEVDSASQSGRSPVVALGESRGMDSVLACGEPS
jgi:hypothetical protein